MLFLLLFLLWLLFILTCPTCCMSPLLYGKSVDTWNIISLETREKRPELSSILGSWRPPKRASSLVKGHVPTHPFPEASPDPNQTLDLAQGRGGTFASRTCLWTRCGWTCRQFVRTSHPARHWIWKKNVTNRWYTGLEMATATVTNATKMLRLATWNFQAVAKLPTSSKLTT